MTLLRIPALALALATLALPGRAQTTNPISATLPLSVHTSTGCRSVTDQTPRVSILDEHTGAAHASCAAGTNSRAVADLSSGTLRAVAQSQYQSSVYSSGSATAALYETLTFAGLVGTQPITLKMNVHGSFSPDPFPGGSDVFGTLFSSEFIAGFHLHESNAGDVYTPEPPVGRVTTNADPITGLFDRDDVRVDLSRTFLVSASNNDIWFLAKLDVFAGGTNEVVDFGKTARLSLDLPPGVTFTSASGLFLTDIATPIPEPETVWLLLAGIVPLVARMRWVRRAAAKENQLRHGAA